MYTRLCICVLHFSKEQLVLTICTLHKIEHCISCCYFELRCLAYYDDDDDVLQPVVWLNYLITLEFKKVTNDLVSLSLPTFPLPLCNAYN